MGVLELGKNLEGEISMKTSKTARVNGMNRTPTQTKAKGCVHQCLVDYQYNEHAQPSGNLVCRECGAVIPDPVKVSGWR